MKLRLLLSFGLLFAAAAQAQDVATDYHYGMRLDVARVLSMTEPVTEECQVIKAAMTYLDSSGQEHTLRYLKLAEVCSDQG
ncbi:DUF2790 domain-containing protein [Pseudomonas huaxiensis]|uniref:DUF2790 domain-containing protein n=1 Tax=Pseudomonas huaxiensis TaxID=2213017 RepID=UPI000DA67BD7|nr:DUF2790 domain-containing protein [Pseudomonas huaxiensis]